MNMNIKHKDFAYLIQFHTYKTSKWINYENINIYHQVLFFIYDFSQKYVIYDYHLVITFIYFKRLINIGNIHNNPLFILIFSFSVTIKFWDESKYICQDILIKIKNILYYEYKILKIDFKFLFTLDLFKDSYNLLLNISDNF